MKQAKRKRLVLKPADVRDLCHEVSQIGDGAEPARATGWTKDGRWTRLEVEYPNDWVLSVCIDKDGMTSSYTAKCKLTLRAVSGGAATNTNITGKQP